MVALISAEVKMAALITEMLTIIDQEIRTLDLGS